MLTWKIQHGDKTDTYDTDSIMVFVNEDYLSVFDTKPHWTRIEITKFPEDQDS